MRQIKIPRGHRKSSLEATKKHFDYDNSIYAEEHYGKYLIVKNTNVNTTKHNRIYISRIEQIEFIKHPDNVYQKDIRQGAENKYKKPTKFHLLDTFPDHRKFIWNLLSKLDNTSTRPYATSIIKGLRSILNILIGSDDRLILKNADSFNHTHHTAIQESINSGTSGYVDHISATWKFIVKSRTKQDLPLSFFKTEIGIEKTNQVLPLDVVYQLDFYAQMELDKIMPQIAQLKKWMKEFDSLGELFNLQNLTYTHYYLQGNNPAFNYTIGRTTKELYSIDLKCYRQTKYDKCGKKYYLYKNEEQRQQHEKLLAIAKDGMDLSINNEKMLIFWLKRIAEDFPFLTKYKAPFEKVWISPINVMAQARCKALGIKLADLKSKIAPNAKHLYPLFLIILIRTGANQEVIRSWTVNKTENGEYELGEKWSQGRMIVGNKFRGNTEQVSIISKRSVEEKYLRVYLDWLCPIYNASNSRNFLQYASEGGKVNTLSTSVVQNYLKQDYNLYHKYEIYNDGERI